MQIKKAAELSGLTERAVRLYEERGLIFPEHINKNGRDFREYSEEDVEKLKAIALLRRALFTIDEIRQMKDLPETIPQTVVSHRERMHTDFESLSYIIDHLDRVDEAEISSAEELAAAIFSPAAISSKEHLPTEEEKILFSEQYEKIYEKYFSENTDWERRYDLSLAVDGFLKKLHLPALATVLKCFLAVLCVGSVIFFVCYAIADVEKVEYTLSGYSFYLSDENERIPCEVRIEGKYKNYIIRDDTFEGLIYIDGYVCELSRESYKSSFFVSEKGCQSISFAVDTEALLNRKYAEINHADRAYTDDGDPCMMRINASFDEDFRLSSVVVTVYSGIAPGTYTLNETSRIICVSLNDPDEALNFYRYYIR